LGVGSDGREREEKCADWEARKGHDGYEEIVAGGQLKTVKDS